MIFNRLAGQASVASALVVAAVTAAGAQLRTLKGEAPARQGLRDKHRGQRPAGPGVAIGDGGSPVCRPRLGCRAHRARLVPGGEYLVTVQLGMPVHPGWCSDEFGRLLKRIGLRRMRYDTKLWMRDLMEGAAYLPK